MTSEISQEDMEEFGIEFFDDKIKQNRPVSKQEIEQNDQPENQQRSQKQQPQEENKGFARKAVEKAADYGVFGSALQNEDSRRNVLRSAARVGETLSGMPGDVVQMGKSLGGWLGNKARSLIGKEALNHEDELQVEELKKTKDWDVLSRLTESLPTSENLRENVTRKYTGDYLEPQNKWEAFSDDIAQDFASLALPVKGKIPFARAIGTSLIANSGGEIAGEFLGEDAKGYTKLGLLFSSGMIGQNKGGVKKYINSLYSDMRSEIPEGARVSSKGLEKKLNSIESTLRKGDPGAASKQEAFKKIDAVRNKIQGGEIPLDEVLELAKDTNEVIFSGRDIVRNQNKLFDIREALHDTTKEYGSRNAAFLDKWKDANQAYAATELSRKVGGWVKKNIKPKDYMYAASALGLEGAFVGAPAALATAGVGAASASAAYSAEVLKRISKSPALRKYYTNTVNSSLNQNKASFMRNIKFLNDGLEKSFESEPYETIDFSEEEVKQAPTR